MTSRKWYIRRSDGRVLEFADMTALRGAIDAGLVDVDDEVSRNQTEWSPLTSIAEFQSLFQFRSHTSKVPVVEAFSQAAKPFEEPDFDAGLNHLTGQMATIRGQRPTQFQSRNTVKTISMSVAALLFGTFIAWGIQVMMESQERDAAAEQLISEAKILFAAAGEGDFEKSLGLLDEVKKLERGNFESTTLRGSIYYKQARRLDLEREEGRRMLSQDGVHGDPKRLELESNLSELSKRIETKVALSFESFEDVLELDPDYVEARKGMLSLAMFRGQRPEVLEHVSVLKRLIPKESLVTFAEAWSLANTEPSKSLQLLTELLSGGYVTLDVDRLFAQVLVELKKWDELRKWLENVDVKDRVPEAELTRLLTVAQQLEDAEKALSRVNVEPSGPEAAEVETDGALLTRAAQLRRRDKPKSAARLYRRVIERNAKPPIDALIGLGWCLFDLNLPYESKEEFSKAIARSSRSAEAHLGLAEVLRSLDDSAAVEHFETYLKLRPSADDADYVRRVIEQLR